MPILHVKCCVHSKRDTERSDSNEDVLVVHDGGYCDPQTSSPHVDGEV